MSASAADQVEPDAVTVDMRERPEPPPSKIRYVLYAIGVAMIAIGLKGIVHDDKHWENPTYWVRLFVGGALVHDLLIVPIVAMVSTLLTRFVPALWRGPIQLGLFASAVFGFVAYAGIRQFGAAKDNTSANPLNYAHGLLICLGVIWAVVAGAVVRRLLARRRDVE